MQLPLIDELEHSELAKQKRREKKTVCIVGFAPTSRHAAPYDEEHVEIWGLNEAYNHDFMKRWTRWFQIHSRWSYTRKNNKNDEQHWEWLQKKHDFPIYVHEVYDDVPSGVKYPMDEICETLLSHVLRADPADPEETVNKYFTSSFAWMAALIAYEKVKGINNWERLEVYGFEMATDTEYKHQKGSTEFWIGYLAGMGVEIKVTRHCLLLKGELYGVDVHSLIPKDMLQHLERLYQKELDRLTEEIKEVRKELTQFQLEHSRLQAQLANEFKIGAREELKKEIDTLRERYTEPHNKEMELVSYANAYFGAISEAQAGIRYLEGHEAVDEDGNIIAEVFLIRQELDFRTGQLRRELEECMATLNSATGSRQLVEEVGARIVREVEATRELSNKKTRKGIQFVLNTLAEERNKLGQAEQRLLGKANFISGANQFVEHLLGIIDTILPPPRGDQLEVSLNIIGRLQVEKEEIDGEGTEEKETTPD